MARERALFIWAKQKHKRDYKGSTKNTGGAFRKKG
jgi:hypothetical protein